MSFPFNALIFYLLYQLLLVFKVGEEVIHHAPDHCVILVDLAL